MPRVGGGRWSCVRVFIRRTNMKEGSEGLDMWLSGGLGEHLGQRKGSVKNPQVRSLTGPGSGQK